MSDTQKPFICGVVEGFYGRPWTPEQRKELFRRLQHTGMNTYLYAPKDDLKHRANWRDLYTVEEAEHLKALIDAANEQDIKFYYALSPGLDISYSNKKDIDFVKHKLEQVKNMGCCAFALLFDDIDPSMSETDKKLFSTFAHAQVSVTNQVFEYLDGPEFMFCPTEYCGTRAIPDIETSNYLNTIGQSLTPAINIFWTGPRVISRMITVSHVKSINSVLRRKVLIWDNLHANDYDQKRLFLGPYKGRPCALKPLLAGVMTNPNCEFEGNWFAIETLANWSKCSGDVVLKGDKANACLEAGDEQTALEVTGGGPNKGLYNPVNSLKVSISSWILITCTPAHAFGEALYQRKPPTALMTQISVDPSMPVPVEPHGTPINPLHDVDGQPVFGPCPPDAVDVQELLIPPVVEPINSLTNVYDEPMEVAPCLTPSGSTDALATAVVAMGNNTQSHCASGKDPQVDDDEMNVTKLLGDSLESSKSNSTDVDKGLAIPHQAASSSLTDMETSPSLNRKAMVAPIVKAEDSAPMIVDECVTGLSRVECELLVNLFYLPFEHGPVGIWILQEFQWLVSNGHIIAECKESGQSDRIEEWSRRRVSFDSKVCEVVKLYQTVSQCANRGLVYDLYPYIWDATSMLLLLNAFLSWIVHGYYKPPMISDEQEYQDRTNVEFMKKYSKTVSELFDSWDPLDESETDCEPWAFKGGLVGEFQRLLPLETCADLFTSRPPHPPTNRILIVRPYDDQDWNAIDQLSVQTFDDGLDASERFVPAYMHLIYHYTVAPFIKYCRPYSFVVVLNDCIVGYAVGTLDAKQFAHNLLESHYPELQSVYPKTDEIDAMLAMTTEVVSEDVIMSPPSEPVNHESVSEAVDQSLTDQFKRDIDECSQVPATAESESTVSAAVGADSEPPGPVDLIRDPVKPETIIAALHRNEPSRIPKGLISRYPSRVIISVLPSAVESAATKRLAACLLSSLKANGSTGVYCQLSSSDTNLKDLYTKLGFFEVTMLEEKVVGMDYLGRLL